MLPSDSLAELGDVVSPMHAQPTEAVILAGGFGTRLQNVVSDRPKPMAEIAGHPFLERLVYECRRKHIRQVIFCTGYMGQAIEDYFSTHPIVDVEIVCSQEEVPLGTAGALKLAAGEIESETIAVFNGDSFCAFDMEHMWITHRQLRAAATILLSRVPDVSRYGSVSTSETGAVTGFHEKSNETRPGLVNAGVYLMDTQLLDRVPAGESVSLEREVFPALIGQGLCGYVVDSELYDIGTPSSYARAAKELPELLKIPKEPVDADE
jgi:NDP-sugar pyrophosphorylase family protein